MKTKGNAYIQPLLMLIVLMVCVLGLYFIYKIKSKFIYFEMDDDVTVSVQSLSIHDQYYNAYNREHTSSMVFDAGSSIGDNTKSRYYLSEPSTATVNACRLAYQRLVRLLDDNLELADSYRIESFIMVNVISGRAYRYDLVNHKVDSFLTDQKSYLDVTVSVAADLDQLGTGGWTLQKHMVLKERN